MSRWIGLCGRAGAGKDHAFEALRQYMDFIARVSFADVLRREIQDSLGLDEPITKPYTELERKLQIWWGTDYRRAENPDYWVQQAEKEALMVAKSGVIPVFTDVRFPNEARMIQLHGGLIVRVMAPPEVREARLGFLPPEHASETAMDDYEVDMHITSIEGNPSYHGQIRRVIVEATIDDIDPMAKLHSPVVY